MALIIYTEGALGRDFLTAQNEEEEWLQQTKPASVHMHPTIALTQTGKNVNLSLNALVVGWEQIASDRFQNLEFVAAAD